MIKLLTNLEKYGVDIELVMKRFINDEELYKECFEMFIEDEEFKNLYVSLINKNFGEAFNIAHSLKGVSANLGLMFLYDKICVLVEHIRRREFEFVFDDFNEIADEKNKLSTMLY